LYNLQSQLITLDSVEFDFGSKNVPFADAVGKNSIDRGIYNSNFTSMVVRTSGYASFASAIIPCGKGKLTSVLGQYNGVVQLTIRDFIEVKISNGNCPNSNFLKNFNDNNITSNGWSTYNVIGNTNWTIGTFGGRSYANITAFGTSAPSTETWLISPAYNLTSFTNPALNFVSASSYSGNNIEVKISTNYVSGTNPSLAATTWTNITATLSPGGFAWLNSGIIPLSAYKTANTTIAFRYTATTAAKTWEIDDVAVIDY
jgi:hypothetical protein